MKNLQTTLGLTEAGKWKQNDARAMKKEIENALREFFLGQDIEVYECDKGFNVELFDADGRAFAVNINPVVKASDFNIVDAHDEELDDRARKEQEAKDKKAKSDAKKEQDRLKREKSKSKK